YEMLRRRRVEGRPVTEVATAFGVSRQAFYAAETAFTAGGLPGLLPRPRGPNRSTSRGRSGRRDCCPRCAWSSPRSWPAWFWRVPSPQGDRHDGDREQGDVRPSAPAGLPLRAAVFLAAGPRSPREYGAPV